MPLAATAANIGFLSDAARKHAALVLRAHRAGITMTPQADRNLLVGILALQLDFVSRDQLIAAMHAWILEKATPLDQILRRQNTLRDDANALLTALVAKHLEMHGGDPQRSLAAISSLDSLRRDLRALADPDIEASLVAVPARPSVSSATDVTQSFAGDASVEGKRFRILRLHARGGLGEVFVAEDLELHREVALKEIQADHADDPFSRSRFLLEAEITGGLEHPGIVPVYGLGQYDDGRPFYAMRFIRGDSLKEAVDRFHSSRHAPCAVGDGTRSVPATFDSAEFRKLLGRFVDVCNAIEYAHSRGVLHRDLKPGNIMLGKYGETLVVDWGLAKAQGREGTGRENSEEASLRPSSASGSSRTRMGEVVGTPAYMSPEQAAGRLDELGPASDVYSLGATLYYLLTGQAPFTKDEHGDLLRRVERGEFPQPRSIKPEIPKPLEAICLRAMAKDPRQRYASPDALAEDVERYLADEPLAALPDSFGDRLNRFARRNRTLVRSAAAALLVVTVVSTVAAFVVNEQRRANAKLAKDNGDLAVEKGKLADEKGNLAERNARLFESEREAKTKEQAANEQIARQLRVATALRLAAQSASLREQFPQRAGLLAVAAADATQEHREPLLPEAHQALLDAAQTLQGEPIVRCADRIVVGASQNGRWLVSHASSLPQESQELHWPIARFKNSGRLDSDELRLWDLRDTRVSTSRTLRRGPILEPILSANRRWCAASSYLKRNAKWDSLIEVWDLSSDDPLSTRREIAIDGVTVRISMCNQGRWLLAHAYYNPQIELWDLANSIRLPLEAQQAAMSDDGRRLAVINKDGVLTLHDLTEPTPLGSGRIIDNSTKSISGLVISPDSQWLVGFTREGISWLWDLATETPPPPRLLRAEGRAPALCVFSPDSTRFAMILETPATLEGDNSVMVWQLTPATQMREGQAYRCSVNSPSSLTFSPGGQWLAATGDQNAVWLMNTTEGQAFSLYGHDSPISRAVFGTDGSLFTSSPGHAVRRWTLSARHSKNKDFCESDFPLDSSIMASKEGWFAVSSKLGLQLGQVGPEGITLRTLIDRRPDTALREDLRVGRRGSLFTFRGERMAFHPHDKRLAVLSDKIDLWDVDTTSPKAETLLSLEGENCTWGSIAFTADGRFVAYHILSNMGVTSPDGSGLAYRVGVVDLHTKSPRHLVLAEGRVATPLGLGLSGGFASDPGSQYLIALAPKGEVHLFDLNSSDIVSSKKSFRLSSQELTALTMFADGRRFAAGSLGRTSQGKVFVSAVDGPEAQKPRELTHPGMRTVANLASSPDGHWLVVNCREGGEDLYSTKSWLGIFDLNNDKCRVLSGHLGPVNAVSMSLDSRWVATGGEDGTVRLWDAQSPDPSKTQRVLKAHRRGVLSVAFTSDGAQLVSTGYDDCVRRWDLDVALLNERLQLAAGRLLTPQEVAAFEVPSPSRPKLQEAVHKLLGVPGTTQNMMRGEANDSFSAEHLRIVRDDARGALATLKEHADWERFEDAVRAHDRGVELVARADRILEAVDSDLQGLAARSLGTEVETLSLLSYRFYDQVRRRAFDDAFATFDLAVTAASESSTLWKELELCAFLGDSLEHGELTKEELTRSQDNCRSRYFAALRIAVGRGVGNRGRPACPKFLRDSGEYRAFAFQSGGKGQFSEESLAFRARGAQYPQATASHTSPYDKVGAAHDGLESFRMTPHNRWTAYLSKSDSDWLQIEFEKETTFSRIELAIYDESPGSSFPDPKGGGVRTPEKYEIQYLGGEEWKPVVEKSRIPKQPKGGDWNEVKFEPVKSKKVRVVFTHRGEYRSGVTEITVWP